MSTIGTPLSATEAALQYGGDYTLTANGDLAIVQDTPFYPYATIQRVIFLILTNPRMNNILNTVVGTPDDLFNPTYGAGARAFVGRANGSSNPNVEALRNNILNALANDLFIQQNPKPTVTFSSPDGFQSTVLCTVSFFTVSGQNVTIPDIPIVGGQS
jgi:hypothetical protein